MGLHTDELCMPAIACAIRVWLLVRLIVRSLVRECVLDVRACMYVLDASLEACDYIYIYHGCNQDNGDMEIDTDRCARMLVHVLL